MGQGGAGECVCTTYVALTTRLNRFSPRRAAARHGFLFFAHTDGEEPLFFPHNLRVFGLRQYFTVKEDDEEIEQLQLRQHGRQH